MIFTGLIVPKPKGVVMMLARKLDGSTINLGTFSPGPSKNLVH